VSASSSWLRAAVSSLGIARRVGPAGRAVGLDRVRHSDRGPASLPRRRHLGDRIGSAKVARFNCRSRLLVRRRGVRDVLSHVRAARPPSRSWRESCDRATRRRLRLATELTAFTHSDRALTRRIVAASSDALAVDGWLRGGCRHSSSRPASRMFRVRGFFPLETDPRKFLRQSGRALRRRGRQGGRHYRSRAEHMVDALHAQRARGPIIAGRLHIFVRGRKPA